MTSIHQAAVHGSGGRFLEIALPLVRDGLAEGDPVMVTTTSADLELLAEALGRDGRLADYAESAFLGRRTVERATAFHRYRPPRGPEAPRGGHVRILADPVVGFLPPRATADPGDGLWTARQLCDRLDIHNDRGGCVIQLHVPSARAEESRQSRTC